MKHRVLLSLAALTTAASVAVAQAPAAPAGIRGEILFEFDFAANRALQLAEKLTQEQYAWRPGTGVRSTSEVLVHLAVGSAYIASLAGAPAFAMPNNPEKTVTDKAQVIDLMKRSFEHVRQALRNATDADLDKAANLFGRPTTSRGAWLLVAAHAHEHLGQLIAYARSNSVVPPWSN
jgi:uncharacterized damage-inducible protein DinB